MMLDEIEELKNQFVNQLTPIRIYLFGSYATGNYTEKSDLDFYIIVNDEVSDLAEMTMQAYRAIRQVKRRPVDIIIGTKFLIRQKGLLSQMKKKIKRIDNLLN